MAAAMFRPGTGSCVRCIQRELCRVIWRPQAALYSSKPSDTKQPRRTHIKKGKPQPAVDVTKLLEQIFSQQRPGTARPAGKVRPAKASSVFTKPPPTSSVRVSASKTEPAVSVFPAASSFTHVGADKSSGSSQTSTQTECQPSAETIETKVETAAEPVELTEKPSPAPFPAATVEPLTETTVESPVEPLLSPAETREMKAAVVEGPVESAIDVPAEETQASATVCHEEPLVETAIESQIETRQFPVETLETRAVDGPVEPTIEAQKVETESADSGVVDISYTTTVEPTLETVELSVEACTSQAAAAECALEPTVDATVEAPAQVVQTHNHSHTAVEEPLIETTIDASVESSNLQMETPENRAAVAESSVEIIEAEAETAAQFEQSSKEEPLIETAIETPVEASNFPVETLETQAVEGPVEAQKVETTSKDSGSAIISYITKDEPLIETTIEAAVETSSSTALTQNAQESAATGESEEGLSRSEEMTLESVTLLEDELLVASLKTDELLQTKSILDERAETELQELLVQTETGAQSEAAAQTESQMLTEVLSKWDSLSEDLQELEGESSLLVKELLCHAPAVLSKPPATSSAKDPPAGASGESLQETEAVSMTLESITLANVKAEVGGLDTEVLQETMNALEEEAGVFAEQEKMEVTPMEEDVAVFEETAEAEMLTLDSICEATDAIEAETSIMLEAMFGSEQGLRQPLQKQEQLDGSAGLEAVKESRREQQEVAVLEAMSLESVTLAEVEASLGTLENETLSETADYLEKEAEMVVGEERAEVGEVAACEVAACEVAACEETAEALEVEALTEDLQIDALMEELLFSEPGHVTEPPMGQEAVGAEISDETVVSSSVHVDTAAVLDSSPASPTLKEELLEEKEEEEKGAQAEASGSEEPSGIHADLDPVQRLFLEKIREYRNMHRLNGGLLEAEPDYEKYLLEETAKLQRLYGGGDLNSFPQFTFSDPEMDQDSK